MVPVTKPMLHWSELQLVLSPAETFKAAALGGMRFDEAQLKEFWLETRRDRRSRAVLYDGAAFGLHLLLSQARYEPLLLLPYPSSPQNRQK